MNAQEFIDLFRKALRDEEHSYWYDSGNDIKAHALDAMQGVLDRIEHELSKEGDE